MHKTELIANYHCGCGENPLWQDEEQALYWTDIPGRKIFRYDRATGTHALFHENEFMIGGFTFQADGSLLLFEETTVSRLAGGTRDVLFEFTHEGIPRFNDVFADPGKCMLLWKDNGSVATAQEILDRLKDLEIPAYFPYASRFNDPVAPPMSNWDTTLS